MRYFGCLLTNDFITFKTLRINCFSTLYFLYEALTIFYFRKRAKALKPPSPNENNRLDVTPSPLNEPEKNSTPQKTTEQSEETKISEPSNDSEDKRTNELEPGELASDSSVKSSSEEDENPNQAIEKEDHNKPTATLPTSPPTSTSTSPTSGPSLPLTSVDLLLDYCRSQLSPKPHSPPSLPTPAVEFRPISRPAPQLSVRSQSRYQPYRSPLAAFRSYR